MAVELKPGRRAPGPGGGLTGKLHWKTKLAYGFGDSSMSASATIVGFFYLYFLTDVVGLRPSLAGSAILLGRLYDAVTDPFEGYLSDRTRTRWGRRRPYLLFGAVPFGLTFLFMFLAPTLAETQVSKTLLAGLAYVLHMTAYTGVGVPYSSLTAELTEDYDERTSLTAYRMAFAIAASLLAAAGPLAIVGLFAEARAGYAVMALAFGLFMIIPPLVVFVACREPPRARVLPLAPRGRALRDFLGEMVSTLENRPFRLALGVYLLTWIAMDVLQTVFIYFIQYVMDMQAMAPAIFGVAFLVAGLSLPLWVWVSRRWNKKVAYVAGMCFLAGVLLSVAVLRPGMVTAVYVLALLAGVGFSAANVIPWSMIPDCVEFDELTTGRRREGQHYGFMTFAQKAASSGAIFLTSVVLEASGYVPGGLQPASAVTAMRLLLGGVPTILFVAAMALLSLYRIDRAEHTRVIAELQARREGAAPKE